MTQLDELIVARDFVKKALYTFAELDLHEIYSVRLNIPFSLLQKSNLTQNINNVRDSLHSILHEIDAAIKIEEEMACHD